MNKKVLVTGATGFQGNAVVQALLTNGFSVKALALADESTSGLKSRGVEIAVGNFEDKESLKNAFQDVHHVVLSFPLIFDAAKLLSYAKNFVDAVKISKVQSVVFITNLPVYPQKVGLIAFDVKLAIEQLFDTENLPYISIRPTLYMDNLSAPFLLPVIQRNNILPYPVPAGKKIAWISHKDLAKFAVEAIKRPELVGQKFFIGGSQLISGEEMAEVLTNLLGRHIQFIPVSPDDFEVQLSGAFGGETAKEIANIYRFVKDNVEHFQAKDLRENTLIKLPVSLQTFEEWAGEVKWG